MQTAILLFEYRACVWYFTGKWSRIILVAKARQNGHALHVYPHYVVICPSCHRAIFGDRMAISVPLRSALCFHMHMIASVFDLYYYDNFQTTR